MRGYITLNRPRIPGARLHIHWSALLAGGTLFGIFIRQPIQAFVIVVSYFSVILLHEAGHALLAKRYGYAVPNIYLGFIHGICEFEHPQTLKEHAVIAWGGVLAQLVVAVPLVVLSQITPLASFSISGNVIAILGYLSLSVALVNLAPVRGLDGAVAWRLVPILLREAGYRSTSKKAAKAVIRRIK